MSWAGGNSSLTATKASASWAAASASNTDDVRIDVYGSTGDYLASGIDGMAIQVHGNAQDQLGQIMKRGKLVVHGDVGQTFMYGAKGGEVYVLGNAAGRPLINAVGRPRVVINGTALDFLAESFMAGDPFKGGGFVIVNGMEYDARGRIRPQATPYPGSNLFSLASGGAIYIRDPYNQLVDEQLNGGELVPLSDADWQLILPYLQENERLFDIAIEQGPPHRGRRSCARPTRSTARSRPSNWPSSPRWRIPGSSETLPPRRQDAKKGRPDWVAPFYPTPSPSPSQGDVQSFDWV